MQKALHILTDSYIYAFGVEKYETMAVMKACENKQLVCPQCLKPVNYISLDVPHFKHKTPNNDCELSLHHRGELQIERVQARLYEQIETWFEQPEIEIDKWINWKRYHLITPYFKIRLFNEINAYNYMSDEDINFFITEYPNVYNARMLKGRKPFYGYYLPKDIIVLYDFSDIEKPITQCPLKAFFLNEKGEPIKKNFKERHQP